MQVRGLYPTVYFTNQISTDHLVPVTPSVSEQLKAFPSTVSTQAIISYALAIMLHFLDIKQNRNRKAFGLYWAPPDLVIGNRLPRVPQITLLYDGNFYDKNQLNFDNLATIDDVSAFHLSPEHEADFQRYKAEIRVPKRLEANSHHTGYKEEMAIYSLINLMFQIQQQMAAHPTWQLVIIHHTSALLGATILGTAYIQPAFLQDGYRIV